MSTATRTRLLFAICLSLGVASIAFSIAQAVSVSSALNAGASLVEAEPRDAIGLTLGVSFLAFAAMLLFPYNEEGPRRTRVRGPGAARSLQWPMVLLGIAAGGLLLSAFAGTICLATIQPVMKSRGYVECPPVADERRAPRRWAKAPLGSAPPFCPRTRREAGAARGGF